MRDQGKSCSISLHILIFNNIFGSLGAEVTNETSIIVPNFANGSFCILENFILNQIKQNNSNYPDAVWVLTDGFGDHIHPLKPDVWNWFLTPNGCIDYIPKQSHVYNLDEFE